MTKPTRKERDNARNRREILDVAVHQFAENGYHETTMQMIADAAEFSVGYLYKHFASKDEMYQEMVAFHAGAMDQAMSEIEIRGLSPLAELRTIYETVCEHFNHHRDFMRIYHDSLGSPVAELVERKKRHFDKSVELLARAVKEGELNQTDPHLLATVIHGATEELFHKMAENDVQRPFDQLPEVLFSLIINPQLKS